MEYHQCLISKGLEKLMEKVESIPYQFLRGTIILLLIIAALWFIIWFLGIGFFTGHWIRNSIIIGAWLLAELINWIGGLFGK